MVDNDIIDLYSAAQRGGELPYFVGKQYGSGWLKTIGRFALPILKRLGGIFYKTATDVVSKDSKILPTLASYAGDELAKVAPNLFENNVVTKRKMESTPRKGINKRRKMNTIFEK
mgnify:FL=1